VPARCQDGTRPACGPDRMKVEALGMTLPGPRPHGVVNPGIVP